MCGISGIFSKNADVSPGEIKEMNRKISHRGPDDDSIFYDEYIALGHRRLSIIDLETRSNQPMTFENLTIVFNGEIYNFGAVRDELSTLGYVFDSEGDCEVILKAYDAWGEKCVQKFKGMWAFVIYDCESYTLFCSRDRFGIKPFYYQLGEGRFYFGSEIKQLIGSQVRPVLDNVVDYLVAGYTDHTESTFFDGIFQLPASCNLKISHDNFKLEITKYFELQDPEAEDTGSDVSQLLTNSIREHLIADVPVGSCLSGGLDSSFINYGIAQSQPGNIAIHCNSVDHEFSEKDKAQLVAKSLGSSFVVTEPDISEFKLDIDELFYTQEIPFGDPSVYMQYRVMKKASELGVRVMLDGQGADEVFMGYSKYLGVRLWNDLSFLTINRFIREFRSALRNTELSIAALTAFMLGTKYERIKRVGLLLTSKMPLTYWASFVLRGGPKKNATAFQYSEVFCYPLQTLLRNEDRNSMRFSIEARVPYLDHELVHRLFHEDTTNKVSGGWTKSLLRANAVGRLPDEIVYRRDKLGFNSPPSWLNQISYDEIYESKILASIFGDKICVKWVASLDNKMRWRLLSVAIWERIFNAKI